MIDKGYFLLTDISGYTMFLTQSELDHADDILKHLFKTLLKHIQPPLVLSNFQGDAILSYLPDSAEVQPQTVLETVERLYVDFHRQLELMRINTGCKCKACSNMGSLDLKVFLHHGSYLIQEMENKQELMGADVIIAHRMMKNGVKEKTGLNGYGLITDAALESLGGDTLLDGLIDHSEEYEHIGAVPMKIYPLPEKWKQEREKSRIRVQPEEAWICGQSDLNVPPEAAWNIFVDLALGRQWFDLEMFSREDDLGGRLQEGSALHCVHDTGVLDYMIIDWNPNEFYFTNESTTYGFRIVATHSLDRTKGGSRYSFSVQTPPPEEDIGDRDMFKSMSQPPMEATAARLARVVQEQIDAGKILVSDNPVAEEDAQWKPPEPIA